MYCNNHALYGSSCSFMDWKKCKSWLCKEGLCLPYYRVKEASFICERLYLNLISPPQLIDISQKVVRKVPSENRVYLLTWLIVGWTRSGRLECAVKGLLFVISLYNTVLSLRYILYVRFMYFVATLKRFLY